MIRWDCGSLPTVASEPAGDFVSIDGKQMHYLKIGSGPPLILVHGYFYDSQMWSRNISALSEHFSVYAIDLWGCGLSSRGRYKFGYDLFSTQVRLFMDALEIPVASFCGQGMGGGIIVHLASAFPERVSQMILVDTAGQADSIPWTARLFRSPLIALPLFAMPGDMVRRHILGGHFIGNLDILTDAYFAQITAFHRIAGTSRCLLDMLRADFFHTLDATISAVAKENVPTLIVWGELDESNPLGQGELLAARWPHAQFVVLDGAGHVANADQPEAFNELALGFLRGA